ncbi:unnamed protein product [Chrysoparadoxa australica]
MGAELPIEGEGRLEEDGRLEIVGESTTTGFRLHPAPYNFHEVEYMQPHPERKARILAAHPEIEELYGPTPLTKYLTVVLVVTQLALAVWVGRFWNEVPFWSLVLLAYAYGATMNHACAMVIHDCAHDLAASSPFWNRCLAIFANFPMAIPSAMSFRRYHLEHHSHQGVVGTDLDLPPTLEVGLVKNRAWRKLLWVILFAASYGLRPGSWGRTKLASKWEVVNVAVVLSVDAAMAYFFGLGALLYLLGCTVISFGVHPCAAHFLQEHFTLDPVALRSKDEPQETFSYYGPFNPFVLNVGYHNEHHDFSQVSWVKLPQITKMAPEFYLNLFYHSSVLSILKQFLSRDDQGPHSRVVRSKDSHKLGVRKLLANRKAARLRRQKKE